MSAEEMDGKGSFKEPRCLQLEAAKGPPLADERRTLQVVVLTAATMLLEIVFGLSTGSMALLADGWHMGTHAFALGISYAAFRMARAHARSGVFSFGTGKFSVLSGYTSSLFLGGAGVWMIVESFSRLLKPVAISYGEALGVAVFGLLVNVASIFILGSHSHEHGCDHEREHNHDHKHDHEHEHSHDHEHDHEHEHSHERHDHNYKAAYFHVLADALTSVFAIAALLCGMLFGWRFLDSLMGVVGGVMIGRWAWGLLRETGAILLDADEGGTIRKEIVKRIEADSTSRICDMHVWRIGSHDVAALVSVCGHEGRSAEDYKARLAGIPDLLHVSVELSDGACGKP